MPKTLPQWYNKLKHTQMALNQINEYSLKEVYENFEEYVNAINQDADVNFFIQYTEEEDTSQIE